MTESDLIAKQRQSSSLNKIQHDIVTISILLCLLANQINQAARQ